MEPALTAMRVLLLSPVRGVDPSSGDVVYTETLLENPPAGVVYETYTEALERGTLTEFGRRNDYDQANGVGRAWALARVAREHALNALRRNGFLFREPF